MPLVMRAALAQWGGRHGVRVLWIAFFVPAALLFAPVLYYSLDTPFGLVDDYADWKYSLIFTSPALFREWLDFTFLDTDLGRYRPFWEIYNAVAWSIFGTNPWLHHLSRWVFHFAAILMFALAFLRFARAEGEDGGGRTWMLPLIPVAFLVYLWMFFPNSPASRLSPQEVYTVFFLGMCTLVVATTLKSGERKGWLRSGGMKYSLFLVGYTGLILSKEPNFAVALWLLLAYVIHATRSRRWVEVIGSIPLVLLFAFTCSRIYIASDNYSFSSSGSFGPVASHAEIIAKGLFQVETSLIITAIFALFIVVGIAISFMRRMRSDDFLFQLFLIGQILSLFFIIAFSEQETTLRYWYPMIPIFVLMMAFSVKYLVILSRKISPLFSGATISLVIAFTAFFIMINYYNYSSQTIVQHGLRKVDESMLVAIDRLHASRKYVHNYPKTEQERNVHYYFAGYRPFFRGLEIEDISWVGWPMVIDISFVSPVDHIHLHPPPVPNTQYFTFLRRVDSIFDVLNAHDIVSSNGSYKIISHAYTLAEFLQGGTPHRSVDFGNLAVDGTGKIEYQWSIYRVPFGDAMDRVIDAFRAIYDRAIAGETNARSIFDVYSIENQLVYVREQCADDDTNEWFFLHLSPADIGDLPREHRQSGFDNLDFPFETRGVRFDGRCVAVVQLPDYAIASIRTGQIRANQRPVEEAWGVEFVPGLDDLLRATYEQAKADTPIVRSTFDIHFIENQLVYVREQCATEDTDDWFFLHLTPVDTGDLPNERREYGFDGLDFRFALRGSRFDGRCVAVVPLPDYPIAGIRTGQYGDGGETWSVEFAPER